jgi:SPP1 gp7 family putative phage head morphogenesis protein
MQSRLLAPRRPPPPPKASEDNYRRRLRALVGGAIERAYRPLLDALPRLVDAVQAQRSGTRQDAGPVDDAARLVRDGQQEFSGEFATKARSAGAAAAQNIAAHTKQKLRRHLDEAPDRRINAIRLTDSPRLKPLIDAFVAENVALIKGISPRLAADVQGIVVQGLTNGVPAARLAEQIRERMNMSARRAELIAIDQIGKLDGKLTEQRHRDLGITHFTWRSSEDERVRGNPEGKYPRANPSHWYRNGKRYAYADPPRGKNGEMELPGTPPRCRCWQDPDLSTINGAAAESPPAGAEPTQQSARVLEAEAEAARMMAEVEELLVRQQAEIEERMRPPDPPPAPPPQDEQLDDPAHEAQAQGLVAQLASAPPAAAETALARYRRWKRRGRQVRGDQFRSDYNPDQPRAPDGRFGEVAGEHEGKAQPAPEQSREERALQRSQERAARIEAVRRESVRRGRMMQPDEWRAWVDEAERDMDNARNEIESATDDLRDAADDAERSSASERITSSRALLEDAKGRLLGFSELVEGQAMRAPDDPFEDEDEDDQDEETSSGRLTYRPLSSGEIAQYEKEISAVDEEKKRGFAKESHPSVTFRKSELSGVLVGSGSVGRGIPVEELTHAFAPPDGYTAVVDDVTGSKVSMSYYRDGKLAGEIVRDFRPDGEIHHTYLVLNGEAGSGFSDTVNGQALLRYEKLGIKKVTVDAAWVGRYKWATMGFRFAPAKSSRDDVGSGRWAVEQAAEEFFEEYEVEEEAREQVRELLDRPWDLAKLDDGNLYDVKFKAGPDRARGRGDFDLGKALLLHDSMPVWAGVLDIDRENEGYLHALRKLKVETRK